MKHRERKGREKEEEKKEGVEIVLLCPGASVKCWAKSPARCNPFVSCFTPQPSWWNGIKQAHPPNPPPPPRHPLKNNNNPQTTHLWLALAFAWTVMINEWLPWLFQIFSYTKKKALQTDDMCLDVSALGGPVKLFQCHGLGGNQKWEYHRQVQRSPCLPSLPLQLLSSTPPPPPCFFPDKTQLWPVH